jgi:hypothetical protein
MFLSYSVRRPTETILQIPDGSVLYGICRVLGMG